MKKKIYLYADRLAQLLEENKYGDRAELRQSIIDYIEILKMAKGEGDEENN